MSNLLVVNALLLPMADPQPGVPDWYLGWLAVDTGGRISGIGPGQPPADLVRDAVEVRDLGGAIVAPGFLSAHSHLFTSGLRGIATGSTLYPWVRVLQEYSALCSAEDMYWSTFHGALDFVANGITTAYNFTAARVSWLYDAAQAKSLLVKMQPAEYLTRQFDAVADSGMRTVPAIRLDDEAGPELEVLETFAEMVDAAEQHTPADQFLGASVMGAVQWATAPRSAELEAQVMAEHRLTNQAHFVETAESIEFQQSKFDWYQRAGALGPQFLFGHFVHPTDEMVKQAAATGCQMVWQPTSNGRLGSGLADVIRFREAGIGIGIGLDDQACTDISDPFANMRMGLYGIRAKYTDASILMPREVLRMHTLGSAEVLGAADKVGSLEVGKFADFLVVDHRLPDTGPVWDVYGTYVLACGLRNLKEVWIGGKLASRDGVCTAARAAEAAPALLDRVAPIAQKMGTPLAIELALD